MAYNKQTLFKFRKRPQVFGMIHIFIFVLGFVFFILYCSRELNTMFLVLMISTIVLQGLIYILANYFGWNSIIYFENEHIWQKVKGRIYEWKWEDIVNCKVKTVYYRTPSTIEIITTSEETKLKFEISSWREKILLDKCPNVNVKEIFKKTFDK